MVSVCLPSDALLATPTVLLGSLLPWTWGISSWLLQLSAGAVPYLGQGVWIYRFIKLIESAIILCLAFLLCDLKEKKKWTSIWLHCSKVAAKESDTEAIKNNPEVKKSIQNQVTVEDRKTPVSFPMADYIQELHFRRDMLISAVTLRPCIITAS